MNVLRHDWKVLFQPRRLYNEGWCQNEDLVPHPTNTLATLIFKFRQLFTPNTSGHDTMTSEAAYTTITALIAACILVGIFVVEFNRRHYRHRRHHHRRNQSLTLDGEMPVHNNKTSRKSSGESGFYDVTDVKRSASSSEELTIVQRFIDSIMHPERRMPRSTYINTTMVC